MGAVKATLFAGDIVVVGDERMTQVFDSDAIEPSIEL